MAPDRLANDGFALRLALFYAGLCVVIGIQMPLFPVWLSAKGLDPQAIGLVLALPTVIRLFSVPVLARAADRRDALRGMLVATSFAAAATFVAVGFSQNFWAILATVAVATAALTPTMPLADAYALKGLSARGRAYGPVRLWGSVAFIAANLGAGLLLDLLPRENLVWTIAAALAGMAAASLLLRPLERAVPARAAPTAAPDRLL